MATLSNVRLFHLWFTNLFAYNQITNFLHSFSLATGESIALTPWLNLSHLKARVRVNCETLRNIHRASERAWLLTRNEWASASACTNKSERNLQNGVNAKFLRGFTPGVHSQSTDGLLGSGFLCFFLTFCSNLLILLQVGNTVSDKFWKGAKRVVIPRGMSSSSRATWNNAQKQKWEFFLGRSLSRIRTRSGAQFGARSGFLRACRFPTRVNAITHSLFFLVAGLRWKATISTLLLFYIIATRKQEDLNERSSAKLTRPFTFFSVVFFSAILQGRWKVTCE